MARTSQTKTMPKTSASKAKTSKASPAQVPKKAAPKKTAPKAAAPKKTAPKAAAAPKETKPDIKQLINDFFTAFLTECAESDYVLEEAQNAFAEEETQDALAQVIKGFPVKTIRAKAKTDPNKPKRNKSAYLYFCAEMRPNLKEDQPELDAKQITSELGRQWNDVKEDPEEIAEFTRLAAEDKIRYATEMADYVPDPNYIKEKKLKDPDAPKRGKSAYLFFCQANRETVKEELGEDAKATEVTKELGARWNAIKGDAEEIAEFTELAAEDKARFTAEMDGYTRPSDEELAALGTNKRRTSKAKGDTEKPKRGRSAYIYFCQANREMVKTDNPEMDAKEITAELSSMWSDTKDTDDAEEYNDLAAEDKARYEQEMADYVPSEEAVAAEAAKKAERAAKKKPAVKKGKSDSTKKRKTGYILFSQQNRATIKEENEDLNAADISKEISRQWKALDEEERQEYNDQAAEE